MRIHYNPKLKHLARELRKHGTLSEALLWNQLKARRMRGYQFMRQKPVGQYVVDFFCGRLRLVIEVDGETHSYKCDEDEEREQWLKEIGLDVMRIPDKEVKRNLSGVLYRIEDWIDVFEKSRGNTTP